MSILGFYWIIFEILWYVSGREFISVLSSINPTVSALESYRSDTLSSLFPVFYSSSWGSQWRLRPGAVPDSRTLPSLPLLSPSSIYPLHLAACQTELYRRPSLQTLTIFVFLFSSFHRGMCICLPFPLFFSLSLLLFSFLPALVFKNRSWWKPKSDGHLKAQLR